VWSSLPSDAIATHNRRAEQDVRPAGRGGVLCAGCGGTGETALASPRFVVGSHEVRQRPAHFHRPRSVRRRPPPRPRQTSTGVSTPTAGTGAAALNCLVVEGLAADMLGTGHLDGSSWSGFRGVAVPRSRREPRAAHRGGPLIRKPRRTIGGRRVPAEGAVLVAPAAVVGFRPAQGVHRRQLRRCGWASGEEVVREQQIVRAESVGLAPGAFKAVTMSGLSMNRPDRRPLGWA